MIHGDVEEPTGTVPPLPVGFATHAGYQNQVIREFLNEPNPFAADLLWMRHW
jgi:hypothetical protein